MTWEPGMPWGPVLTKARQILGEERLPLCQKGPSPKPHRPAGRASPTLSVRSQAQASATESCSRHHYCGLSSSSSAPSAALTQPPGPPLASGTEGGARRRHESIISPLSTHSLHPRDSGPPFWPHHKACGILVPQPGTESLPPPPHWKANS